MTRVTHRVTLLHHQHTKPRWRQGDLITPVTSIKKENVLLEYKRSGTKKIKHMF